jgi:cytochrome c biogenesis protein CcdA
MSLDAFIVSNRNVYLEVSMYLLGLYLLIYECPCVSPLLLVIIIMLAVTNHNLV